MTQNLTSGPTSKFAKCNSSTPLHRLTAHHHRSGDAFLSSHDCSHKARIGKVPHVATQAKPEEPQGTIVVIPLLNPNLSTGGFPMRKFVTAAAAAAVGLTALVASS